MYSASFQILKHCEIKVKHLSLPHFVVGTTEAWKGKEQRKEKLLWYKDQFLKCVGGHTVKQNGKYLSPETETWCSTESVAWLVLLQPSYKVKLKWQNYVWLFVEAVWVWAPLPTHKRLSWKTQCSLSLAHLKEKWDNWITGQTINALVSCQKHDISLGTKPDHSCRRLVTVLTDVGCSCVHSYPEKFPFPNSQARIVIACDIAVTETLSRAAESGRHGQEKEKEAPEYGLGVFCNFFFFNHGRSSTANEGNFHSNSPPHTHTHSQEHFYYLKPVCLVDLLYSPGP